MKELTQITVKTHPELFKPGIIITNAPYRKYFYTTIEITSRNPLMYWHANKHCPLINVLSKNGITIEKTLVKSNV